MNLSGNLGSGSAGESASTGASSAGRRSQMLAAGAAVVAVGAAALFVFTGSGDGDLGGVLPDSGGGVAAPAPASSASPSVTPTKASAIVRMSDRNPFRALVPVGGGGALPTTAPTPTHFPLPLPSPTPSLAPSLAPSPTPVPTQNVVQMAIAIVDVAEDNTSVQMTVNGLNVTAVPLEIIQDMFQVAALRDGNCVDLRDGAGESTSMCEGDFRRFFFYGP